MTTLLLPPSGLTELLFLLPTLEALVASDHVSDSRALLPEPLHALAPLLPGAPGALAPSARLSETVEVLREPGFGEAWILTEGWLPAVLAARAGIAWRIGYGGLLRSLLLTHPVPRPPRRTLAVRHRSELYRELLEGLDVQLPTSWIARLEVTASLRDQGLERIRRAHVKPSEEHLVGLIPGGVDPNHRWPWQRFATLAQTLRREQPSLRFILLAGANDDLWPSVRVHEETARRNPLIGPDLNLAETAGVMTHLRWLVGADGDLLHLAAACGVPTIALFGPTAAVRRRPRGEVHTVVEAPGGSLKQLDVETVLGACRRLSDADHHP